MVIKFSIKLRLRCAVLEFFVINSNRITTWYEELHNHAMYKKKYYISKGEQNRLVVENRKYPNRFLPFTSPLYQVLPDIQDVSSNEILIKKSRVFFILFLTCRIAFRLPDLLTTIYSFSNQRCQCIILEFHSDSR